MERNEKRVDLCGVCAAQEAVKLEETSMTLSRIDGGVNNKITCRICGRRRYGATYEVRNVRRMK